MEKQKKKYKNQEKYIVINKNSYHLKNEAKTTDSIKIFPHELENHNLFSEIRESLQESSKH